MARSDFMKGFWVGTGVVAAVLVLGLVTGTLRKVF